MKIIYAIPGLGTTEKLFSQLKLHDCELRILQWPTPIAGMSLKAYSQKFIEQINCNEKFYLLGVSFGGMICSELSHLINAEKVFLISSCKNKQELPILLRALKRIPIHRFMPENTMRKFAFVSRWILGFKKEDEHTFKEMVLSMPENYLQNTIDMVVNWDKTTVPLKTIHIHGTSDRLLLFKNVKADYVIQKGTHSMIVYQADEISAIINRLLD